MNPEILKAAGAVIGFVVAAPLFYACLKAAALFGSIKTTVEALETTASHLSDSLSNFMSTVTGDLTDKESRLSVVESKVDGLDKRFPERRQN